MPAIEPHASPKWFDGTLRFFKPTSPSKAGQLHWAYDERNHRLVIIERPGTTKPVPDASELDHLAFAYADLNELLSTYRRLRDEGITPIRATDHGSSISYYNDPDRNQVELKVDTIADAAQQHAWLKSDEFQLNPLDTSVDPDLL